MPMPKSVTKIDRKGGVTFTSNVDRISYTINELTRAALRDTAKFLRKKMIERLKQLPGMRKNRRIYKAVQTWVRSREADLQIGFGNTKWGVSGDTWYGIQQELGTKNQPKRSILRDTVYDNISQIREIQAKYLVEVENENKALALINESESLNEGSDE